MFFISSADPAYSHFVVVYANKNSTEPHPSHPSPKNIFEQLQLLDLEKQQAEQNEENTQPEDGKISQNKDKSSYNKKKLTKLSKFKSKLAGTKTKIVKKYKKKLGPKYDISPDYSDPLLALS